MNRKYGLFLASVFAAAALLVPGDSLARPAGDEGIARPAARDVDLRIREPQVGEAMRAGAVVGREPLAAAAEALEEYRDVLGRGPEDGFAFRLEEKDRLGQSHVRMMQTYRGIRVLGGDVVVHLDGDGLLGISGRFVGGLDLPVVAALAPAESAGAAIGWIEREGGANVEIVDVLDPVVWALSGDPVLAVPIRAMWVEDDELRFEDVHVDAATGAFVGSLSKIFTAKNRKVYNMNQACLSTGSELPGTLVISEGGTSSDTAVMGAYDNTGLAYDYYKNVHGRSSYDGSDSVIVSSVHGQFSTGVSCTKNNAAWIDSPYNQMVFGDGDGSTFSNLARGIDVTTHEFSHAVCSRTADLAYQNDSGALNEANSDALGRAAAFYGGNGSAATRTDWSVGADVYTPSTSGDALRYMYDPAKDGDSADYYPTRNYASGCTPSDSNDYCGVHTNSGIGNLFFYLLSQGGTHPRGKTTVSVTGIGLAKAEKIWYRALSVYMTTSTTFQGARTATANAASDLYGGTCTTEWQNVHKAWDAVGVPGTWSCGTTYSIAGSAGTSGATVSAGGVSATSDASGNYTISGLSAGTYTVTATKTGCTFSPTSISVTVGPSATGKNFTASCSSGDTPLTSGQTLTGQSVAKSAWKYYSIVVPSGATNLTLATTGATADVDIYTQSGAKPTSSSYACRPYTSSGNESCSTASPAAGTWWLGVYGYAAGSFTVTGTYTVGGTTYSISGSVGTSGATVTAGSASATSDASNSYTVAGLAAGTYTVTPAKSGCTFTPASRSVTIGSANVTGITFTASCGGGAVTLFTDGFESAGWSFANVSGTTGYWTLGASGTHPSASVHGGSKLAAFNSYTAASGVQKRMYRATGFAVASSYTTVTLKFWMYHDTGYSSYNDRIQPQVSVNGTTWTNVGSAISRYNGSTGWAQVTIDLSAYKGQTVRLGFLGISAYGNNMTLDDVTVTAQ